MTTWIPVRGFEGLYEVSDDGQVRSLDRPAGGRNGSIRIIKGRNMCHRPNRRNGYIEVLLVDSSGKRHTLRVNRIVLDSFVGAAPDGMVSCHNNGIRSDNRLENLRWDSPTSNNFDKRRHGTDHESNKTHCTRGHEYSGANLVIRESRIGFKTRECRSCNKARYYHRTYGHDMQSVSDRFYAQIMSK